jgi:hypothetical protein
MSLAPLLKTMVFDAELVPMDNELASVKFASSKILLLPDTAIEVIEMSNVPEKATSPKNLIVPLEYGTTTFPPLKFKVEGTKYTLVSDYGMEVMVDENDNVVPKQVWLKNKQNYQTRPLKFGKKENGIYYSECIVPQWVMDKFGLKLGEEVKDEMLLFQLGIRIPTQDKHSMVTLKVVETMPSMNESSIVLPEEVADVRKGMPKEIPKDLADGMTMQILEIMKLGRAENKNWDRKRGKVFVKQ